tara:strand:- start:116 stop:802 length:687 start_codon:yes stop_codon:yes gene_type:complete
MNKIFGLLIIGLLLLGCKNNSADKNEVDKKVSFNQELVNDLQEMVVIDQVAAVNAFPPDNYSHLSQEKWVAFKDSVYRTNQKQIEKIFNSHGFVGYDLAGKEGSANFWLLAQHSDHDSEFQKEVLTNMKIQVDKGNADPRNYGLLMDRVLLNTGQNQMYGTQVSYNPETGQAFARKLADSSKVNERRKLLGLEPLEKYLNGMSEMHFMMNKEQFQSIGITEPKLYKIE